MAWGGPQVAYRCSKPSLSVKKCHPKTLRQFDAAKLSTGLDRRQLSFWHRPEFWRQPIGRILLELPIFPFPSIWPAQVSLLPCTRLWGYLHRRRGLEPLRRGTAGEKCSEREGRERRGLFHDASSLSVSGGLLSRHLTGHSIRQPSHGL
jgi:hypothetical protein